MKRVFSFALAAALMMAAACSEPLNEVAEEATPQNEGAETPKKSHWGNKIEDPYSVSNMRLAYKELMKHPDNTLSKAGVSETDIQPTHLHLKFIPKNEEEWRILKLDTILDVVPIPFNYDLEGFDGNYRDPECPDGQPTYQYSVVRIGHKLPNVEYEVLDSLYMPFEDDQEVRATSKNSKINRIWDELEFESIKLTGNLEEDDDMPSLSKKKRVTPDGYVKMKDFSNGDATIPVPRVRVRMNFSTHHSSTYTNAEGYFKMPNSFRSRVHTHVYFDNTSYYASERDGGEIAWYRGRVKMEKNEVMTMDNEDKANYAATIMRAAYDYYTNSKSIKCPPQNKHIPIGLKTKNNGYAIFYTTEFGGHYIDNNQDRIFIVESALCKDKNKVKGYTTSDEDIFGKTIEIYATTIYGLSYISLKNFAKVPSTADPSLLNESYCACVSYVFATDKYGDKYNPRDFRNNYTKFNSGFFIDMIDGIDVANADYVEGYTLPQIEKLLSSKNVVVLKDVADLMPSVCTNSTSDGIKDLMYHWVDWSNGNFNRH